MGNTLKLAAIGIGLSFSLFCVSSWSADAPGTPSSGGTTVDPGMPTSLPPMFDASMAQQMSATMNSCMNFVQPIQQIGDVLQGKNLGGAMGMVGGSCGGADDIADTYPSCDQFKSPSGKFDPSLVDKKQKQLESVASTIACKKAKLESFESEVRCLQTQSGALNAQVTALQKSFETNIHRMQSDVAQIKSVQDDRNAQFVDVTNRLAGDKSTGAPGLLEMKAKTEAAVNQQMPPAVLKIKEDFKQIDLFRKGLEEQIQTRMISQTNDCFNTRTSSGFRCTPNGPPVTIRAYVLCRYEQNQQLGANGTIERGQLVVNQAKANAAGLASVLDSILGDSARTVKVDPANPQAAAEAMNQSVTVMTPDDIEKQYGGQLSGFNGNGLNIHDFVMKEIKSCYSRAQAVIARERTLASSPIGTATEQLNKQQRATQDAVNGFLQGYSQLFTQNMAALTGVHMPLNTSACVNGSPTVQMSCMDDLVRNMQGLLNGNLPQAQMNIQIRGTNTATYIPVTCSGLAGCVTVLQTVSSNIQREVKRLDQFKKDYILKANQNVETFTTQMATLLSPQSQALDQRLKALQAKMASLGVSWSGPRPMSGESLEKDEEGLPRIPKNVMGLVGSKMNPPLPDMSSDGFGQAMTGIADAVKGLDPKVVKVESAIAALPAIKADCLAASTEKTVNTLAQSLKQFQDCVGTQQGCQALRSPAFGGRLDELSSLVSSLDPDGFNDGFSPSATLETGLKQCPKDLSNLTGPVQDAQKRVAALLLERKLSPSDKEKEKQYDIAKAELEEAMRAVKEAFPSSSSCGNLGSVTTDIEKAAMRIKASQNLDGTGGSGVTGRGQ